jgi:hypothetical protein
LFKYVKKTLTSGNLLNFYGIVYQKNFEEPVLRFSEASAADRKTKRQAEKLIEASIGVQ